MTRKVVLVIKWVVIVFLIVMILLNFRSKVLISWGSDEFTVKLRPDIYFEKNFSGTDPNCLNTINNFVTGDGDIQIPNQEDLKDLSQVQLECLYHRYVNTLQQHCTRITRIGPLRYGGWNLCMDQTYTKIEAVGLMISDGKNYSTYLKVLSEQYQHRTFNVKVNLEKSNLDGVKYLDLDSVIKQNELPSKIDILTLDMGSHVVEYLEDSIKTSSLSRAKQLSFFIPGIDDQSKKETYIVYLNVLRDLYTSGFRIIWTGRLMEQVFNRHPKRSKTYIITMVASSPVPHTVVSETYLIPAIEELNSLPKNQLGFIYERYVTSLQILCKQLVRMGRIPDGGWDICHDRKYRPSKDCLVYSFGIDNDFSFDDDMANTYGCDVHSFDPSLNLKEHQHSSKVWFHPVGLSDRRRQIKGYRGGFWLLDSITNIRHELGHDKRRIDVLKMDIEFAEWDVIPTLSKSGILQDVIQLSIELHTPNLRDSDVKYVKLLTSLKALYDSGFRIFWSFTNANCKYYAPDSGQERTGCYEIDMINTNAAKSIR